MEKRREINSCTAGNLGEDVLPVLLELLAGAVRVPRRQASCNKAAGSSGAQTCVEINQCIGCESSCHRAGVASMAWRTTDDSARTRRKILISTQAQTRTSAAGRTCGPPSRACAIDRCRALRGLARVAQGRISWPSPRDRVDRVVSFTFNPLEALAHGLAGAAELVLRLVEALFETWVFFGAFLLSTNTFP